MPTVTPYVPSTITVHLGPPDQWAENVTVSFPDYVKNVASSEIYPTWESAAIRANVLAIISFALNRVYTEYYPSRGYDFQITSSTAYDQKFIRGRNVFENVSRIVDEIFNDYIRRRGFVEPLSAKFCNGTTVTCDGLSQWGSQGLAEQGYDSFEILRRYYGNNIELVNDAPVRDITASYPGTSLRVGAVGEEVQTVQVALNRISRNYPAIPKISPVNGVFGESTLAAVQAFQRVFGLAPDGVVGKATWYRIVALYVGVLQLAELVSEGQTFYGFSRQFPGVLREGAAGNSVRVLQYMLDILAEFDNVLRTVKIDGIFGPDTTGAVRQYQNAVGLTPDGVVGRETWDSLYSHAAPAYRALSRDTVRSIAQMAETGTGGTPPGEVPRFGQFPGRDLGLGDSDGRKAVTV